MKNKSKVNLWKDGDTDRQVISTNNSYLKDYINTTQIGTTEDSRIQKQFPLDCLYKPTSTTVDTTISNQRFIIPTQNVDTNTIIVKVRESSTSTKLTTYTQAENILEVKSTDNVFFVQETNVKRCVVNDEFCT